jgi:hypothetical protein
MILERRQRLGIHCDPTWAHSHRLRDLSVPLRVAVLKVILPWLRQKWGLAETK